ncbi:MAG: polysaccharide biosynthesis/export family protein [Caulobacter sp.]|nr:polysaccharide biosynthesis/export family protein [Caulobacter sp.]
MLRKFAVLALIGATAVLAAACGPARMTGVQTGGQMAPPDPVRMDPVTSATGYLIGPMDQLDVNVFQVPDLTRTVQVDAAGQIILPLIGALNAAGKTVPQLQDDVAEALREKYLQSPEVTIYISQYASQRVTVDGAVSAPGVYALQGRTTLLQVIAMAKGTSNVGNEKRIIVYRMINNQKMGALYDLSAIRAGTLDDPEIYARDVIVVERSGMKSVFQEVRGVLPVFGLFRPLL